MYRKMNCCLSTIVSSMTIVNLFKGSVTQQEFPPHVLEHGQPLTEPTTLSYVRYYSSVATNKK